MKKYFAVLLTFFFCGFSFAQGEGAVPFLTLQQSPMLWGAGQIGTAIPTDNALGFYLNPAQLGNFARDNNLALSFMPNITDWGKNLFHGITFHTFGLTVGYNFNKKNDLPLSLGIGYIHNKFDFGLTVLTDPVSLKPIRVSDNYDSFDCLSIGAEYDYYLRFNLGISTKFFKSVIGDVYENGKVEADGTAFDFGAMVTAPLSELLFKNASYNLDASSYFKPVLNFTLGYSLTNVGKEIYYIDASQKDPLPRTARLGYSLDLGLKLFVNGKGLDAVDYSFTAEAEDRLAVSDSLGNLTYLGLLGNINIGKNLIAFRSDNNVIEHQGHIISFFKTVTLAFGRYNGAGFNDIKTNGLGFSTEGLSLLLSASIDNPVLNFIANHFALKYYDSNAFVNTSLETNFKGLTLYYKNFEF